uniref:Uncharacterized protein n=1 Tax=Molossus molossus TaxID=27622 RepID=A0A7J8CS12_MOLMO|nr:hypothetical protein HJG59_009819 [Molossus molossus]
MVVPSPFLRRLQTAFCGGHTGSQSDLQCSRAPFPQQPRQHLFRRSDTQSRVQRAEITVWAGPCSLRKLQQGICFLAFFASRVAFLGSGLPLPSSKPASQHRQESFFSPTSHSPLRKAL